MSLHPLLLVYISTCNSFKDIVLVIGDLYRVPVFFCLAWLDQSNNVVSAQISLLFFTRLKYSANVE